MRTTSRAPSHPSPLAAFLAGSALVFTSLLMFASPAGAHPFASEYRPIIPVANGMCLDVEGNSKENGARIIQWPCHYGANQQWTLIWRGLCGLSTGVGWDTPCYAIKNLNSGKCMDVEMASIANGAKILQWDCHYQRNQVWSPLQVDAERLLYFRLQSALGNIYESRTRCMDVPGGSASAGVQMQQWQCITTTVAQKFYMYSLRRV